MRSPDAPSYDKPNETAQASHAVLSRHARPGSPLVLHFDDGEDTLELPTEAVSMLRDILSAMASGEQVRVLTDVAELSTFEAAAILNVSRPYLIKLLDQQLIPSRRVGTHRRVRLDDVMAYKEEDDRLRQRAMDQLVQDAIEQDMGYRRK